MTDLSPYPDLIRRDVERLLSHVPASEFDGMPERALVIFDLRAGAHLRWGDLTYFLARTGDFAIRLRHEADLAVEAAWFRSGTMTDGPTLFTTALPGEPRDLDPGAT